MTDEARAKLLYFAYGSNMLSRRLLARVPSATAVGVGYTSDRRLTFDKVSTDGSGKCDIAPTQSPTDRVYGVLFEIPSAEKARCGRPWQRLSVLSQCNTFLLHRIVNDRDQDLVRRLVPDALGDLLRELPSLPSRRAILLGWGAPAPALVEVRELPEAHRPHSPDPDFWNVWTGERPRPVDWKAIADSWAGTTEPTNEAESGSEPGDGGPGEGAQ